jgi:hypothetical protein
MEEEIQSLLDCNTYDLVDRSTLPKGVRPVKCRWVYKVKQKPDGSVERFKARVVAKGYLQQHGVDYNEVFAPVSKHATLRVLLSIAAAQDLEIIHLDIKTAFLNGVLEEDVWMELPEGFNPNPNLVCKLRKALYGLKQAPRQWFLRLRAELLNLEFLPSQADPSLYVRRDPTGDMFLMAYVDDLKCVTNNLTLLQLVKDRLNEVFDVRDLGPASYFLGMEIERDREARTLKLSQRKAIKEILDTYPKSGGKSKSTPIATNIHLIPVPDEEILDQREYPYSELVGKLLYLANCTRPDISHVVGQLCRFMSKPGMQHWNAALGVVKYLSETSNVGLLFNGQNVSTIVGYCDSDYAGCLYSRRSTTGYVFILGGAAVSWSSRLQH